MLAGEETLDDLLGNQFQIANASESGGIEVGPAFSFGVRRFIAAFLCGEAAFFLVRSKLHLAFDGKESGSAAIQSGADTPHSKLFRFANDLEQFFDDVVRRDAIAFGGEAGDEAMSENRFRDCTDVVAGDVDSAVKQSV